MIDIFRAIFGGIMLFTGRDLDWLFSLGLGLLVGQQLLPLLPAGSPLWMSIAVILGMGLIGILPNLVLPEARFLVTGFLFGGFTLTEYGDIVSTAIFGRGLAGSDWIVFIVGAGLGLAILGLTREWGVMFATALVGAFLVADLFTMDPLVTSLVVGGLFVVGGLTQALIMRAEKQAAN